MNYRAMCRFQVYDRGSGPRWLEPGDPVPTGYMGRRLIADFLRMGYMEPIEEEGEVMPEGLTEEEVVVVLPTFGLEVPDVGYIEED